MLVNAILEWSLRQQNMEMQSSCVLPVFSTLSLEDKSKAQQFWVYSNWSRAYTANKSHCKCRLTSSSRYYHQTPSSTGSNAKQGGNQFRSPNSGQEYLSVDINDSILYASQKRVFVPLTSAAGLLFSWNWSWLHVSCQIVCPPCTLSRVCSQSMNPTVIMVFNSWLR